MTSLVEELQRAIIDENISLSNILLKAKLVAAKLKVGVVEEWITKESEGYINSVDLPQYRKVGGNPVAFNPYRGRIPLQGPADFMRIISEVKIRQSIAELERMMLNSQDGMVALTFPPGPREAIRKMLQYPFEVFVEVPVSSLHGILSAVRNAALIWAIELEKRNIAGSNFTFSATEQNSAASMITNMTVYGGFAGVIGSGNQTGDIIRSDISSSLRHLEKAIEKTEKYKNDLSEEGLDSNELDERLQEAKNAVRAASSDGLSLRHVINLFIETLTKAEGSVVAAGISQILHNALALLS